VESQANTSSGNNTVSVHKKTKLNDNVHKETHNSNLSDKLKKFQGISQKQDGTDQKQHAHKGSSYPPEMNDTHVGGVLMEPVNAKYKKNIYFTVKTTNKYYTKRLFKLMSTWFQVVDKNKVSN